MLDVPGTRPLSGQMSRRTLVKAIATVAIAAAVSPNAVRAQSTGNEPPVSPPTVPTGREFGPDASPTTYFDDPDVITGNAEFNALVQGNTAIQRLWTGALWAEGPAWSSQGRYLLWSDIPNNRQMRWLEENGEVSVFRQPSNNSNGNTFDLQGRQISCEHLTRRVVRYEHDGSATILADSYQGKRLNSPNDAAVHPDGSVWFTDPPYGGQLYEGVPDAPGGATNPTGAFNSRAGQPVEVVNQRRELPTNVYRLDPSGRLDLVINEDQVPDPNGLAFTPDYTRLYVASTGKGPGDTGPGGGGNVFVFDVVGASAANQRLFSDCVINGVKCGPDGIRTDVTGHVWISSNAGRNLGYSGVTVWAPDGRLIGRIRIPEVVGNLTFGGPKRNRLFMAASQSIYALYVGTQGAAPG